VPDRAPGEVQVKNIWMTVDPYMRGRMVDRASYVPPFQLGEPLQGGAIGEVIASNDSRLKPGDLVSTMFGWRESFNAPASNLQKLDTFGLRRRLLQTSRPCKTTDWGAMVESEERRRR
jgi:NADPH-dependent curcumin reductase CurA